MRTPSYHNPLLLPNVQHRNPLTLPNSIPNIPEPAQEKSSSQKSSDGGLPEVDGLIGQVNAWNSSIENAKSTMSRIISQYGMGNAVYAQRHDKEYQKANATLNALTSPAYLNQMKRYKRQRDNFETHIDNQGKDRGQEIDLEFYNRTGQIRDYNYVLDAMEENPDFNFSTHSDKPNLTTIDEAREKLHDFVDVKGYNKIKSQGRAAELKKGIVNGMMRHGTQKVTGRTQLSNAAAVNAATKELSQYGISTDVYSGLMRGFLMSSKYSAVLKNHKGKGDVRKSAEYKKALNDYVNDEIQLAGQKNLQNENLAGDASMSVSYRALPDDIIKARAMGTSLYQMYSGIGPGTPINATRVVPGVNRGAPGGYSQRPDAWKTPKGATGQRDNYQMKIYNTPEAWAATSKWKTYKGIGKGTVLATNLGKGSYYYDPNTGNYYSPGDLPGWTVASVGDEIYAGVDKPGREVKRVNVVGSDGEPYTSIQPGAWNNRGRSESERIEAERLSEYYKSQGNFAMAQQIGNMGAGVGVVLQIPKEDFPKWAKTQTVTGTANWEYSKKDTKGIKKDADAYFIKKGYVSKRDDRGGQFSSGLKYVKGNEDLSERDVFEMYLQTPEGRKKYAGAKNQAGSVDFSKEKPLYGSGIGYNDDGIALEHASSFQTITDGDGNEIIMFSPIRGADDFLLGEPDVINQHINNMIQYDKRKMNQSQGIENIYNQFPD